MSKILAISDIHIHDYPQRNPSDKYRLYQSRLVAQNIIKVGKREGADIIVLAGDIIEKSIIRPYVQAEVKRFLDTIMDQFRVGYIIWGNHDQDNKGVIQNFDDACLSVMLPKNLYYADKREVTIDNTRIAFSNWQPEFDLSWINGCVDVLFTHAIICYSTDGTDFFKSQKLDESKFNLAICGDIHKSGQIGKYVSIGIPQKCKMSDSDDFTGVILDCENKSWKWVDLNPDNNLMKFKYTPFRNKEGWESSTGTWYIYKPDNLGINKGVTDIKIPAWEEIDNLINNIILQSGLQNVHGEVLKNIRDIDSKEVDFNFLLTRFYCKNWRSIDEVELYFDDMDKILITGKNGSGKSSLISAIRYAFEENRFIKDFIQFGSKDCLTEVEFIYQGNTYVIQRGSKKYGLKVNGEPMKYNNKKEFEEDVRIRFPFIDYMDIYFFDADHHRLIGGMTPERKSEIVSKFFKMDKIDAYNEVAENLLKSFEGGITKWQEEVDKSENLLKFINQKLEIIQIPTINKDELEKHKREGIEIQRKAKAWSDYLEYFGKLEAQSQLYSEKLNELIKERDNFRKIEQIDLELSNLSKRINEINTIEIPKINSINIEFNSKKDKLDLINNEGNKLYLEWQNLGKTKKCPCCGQDIKNVDSLDKHKSELEKKLTELSNQKNSLIEELNRLKSNKNKSDELLFGFKNEINNLNSKVAELLSEKRKYSETINNIQSYTDSLNKITSNLRSLNKPEKVELPNNFTETMAEIENGLNAWNTFESLMSDKKSAEINIINYKKELDNIKAAVSDLNKYIKITGPTGKIYEEIMTKLADQFSDNQVKYRVVTYNFRKKDHLDLSSEFFNNGNWVSYQACSSGQQTVLDINFLSKIVTRMGLLVMDEFLKHLDPFNHDVCIDMISSMNIGCIMLSSHMESITSFNNKTCNMELNDSGITKITLS